AASLLGAGVEPFELELDADWAVIDGVRYESAPTGLRRGDGRVLLERRRSRLGDGPPSREIDRISLRECTAAQLVAEAAAHGFTRRGGREAPPPRAHGGGGVFRREGAA